MISSSFSLGKTTFAPDSLVNFSISRVAGRDVRAATGTGNDLLTAKFNRPDKDSRIILLTAIHSNNVVFQNSSF